MSNRLSMFLMNSFSKIRGCAIQHQDESQGPGLGARLARCSRVWRASRDGAASIPDYMVRQVPDVDVEQLPLDIVRLIPALAADRTGNR